MLVLVVESVEAGSCHLLNFLEFIAKILDGFTAVTVGDKKMFLSKCGSDGVSQGRNPSQYALSPVAIHSPHMDVDGRG